MDIKNLELVKSQRKTFVNFAFFSNLFSKQTFCQIPLPLIFSWSEALENTKELFNSWNLCSFMSGSAFAQMH